MEKEMQIRLALSYLGMAQAAETFEEAAGNYKKHVEAMINIYNQDKGDDRIAKGLASALGQIIFFYDQEGEAESSLEYNELACEIGKYLHEKYPQKLDLACGYSMSCISIAKTYLELGKPYEANKYFPIADQLLDKLQISYPEDDLVSKYIEIKNTLKRIITDLL